MSSNGSATLPLRQVSWKESRRIVPAGLTPLPLFELTDDPEDLEIAALQIEGAEALDLPRLSPERWVSGPGTPAVMAPFVMPGPSRFSDGRFGVYHAAADMDTAVAETSWHLGRRLADAGSDSVEIRMQLLTTSVEGRLHDLVGREPEHPGVDSAVPDDYAVSRALGSALQTSGSTGIRYASVRRPRGLCAAVFDPRVIGLPIATRELRYRYDAMARGIVDVEAVERLR